MNNLAQIKKNLPQAEQTTDVVIVGGGAAGLSFALCLARSGLQITILERQPLADIEAPAMDGREIALNHFSKRVLTELGVWGHFKAEDVHLLKAAKVVDGHLPYTLNFDRTDDATAPLGYLISNHKIRTALYQQVQTHPNIDLLPEYQVDAVHSQHDHACVMVKDLPNQVVKKVMTKLVVAADSRFSVVRRMMGISAQMKDYGRVMMVCQMQHTKDHEHIAQECFQYGRTCATLPLGEHCSSIVITTPASQSQYLLELDETAFAREAENILDQRLGSMKLISPRFTYPLVGVLSNRFIAKRFALIGDAAVGMHPVTAHGYNLGLRSADTLAQQIIKAYQAGQSIASEWLLHQYEARHKVLSKPLYEGTNAIVQLYTNDSFPAKVARQAVLRVGNHLTPFKKLVTSRLTQAH